MNILIIHNKYKIKGGEYTVVQNEVNLLRNFGHSVYIYYETNNSINSILKKIEAFMHSTYSNKSFNKVKMIVDKFKPDIIHVHNFFPLITPSIYDCGVNYKIPIIQTFHNYRIICPGALLMRDGKICEKCINGNFIYSVFYRCYKNSFYGSLSVGIMDFYHLYNKTWEKKITTSIVLTEFSKSRFLLAGLKDNFTIKPNFVFDFFYKKKKREKKALYVGRISEEKGIKTLLTAWEKINYPITIVGTGPLEKNVKENKNKYINFIGLQEKNKIMNLMLSSSFLIIPSNWYEGFPMVVLEAYSLGLPIIASNIGSLSEIIINRSTGLHFNTNDEIDLIKKVKYLINNPRLNLKYSDNARKYYLKYFTPQKNYDLLIEIYNKAIEKNK